MTRLRESYVVPAITASVIVFSRRGDRVCLIFHPKLHWWNYPGGHLRDGEDLVECAYRETKEETGVDIELWPDGRGDFEIPDEARAQPLPRPFAILRIPGQHPYTDVVFIGRPRDSETLSPSRGQVTDVRWVTIGEVEALVTPAELPSMIASAHNRVRNW